MCFYFLCFQKFFLLKTIIVFLLLLLCYFWYSWFVDTNLANLYIIGEALARFSRYIHIILKSLADLTSYLISSTFLTMDHNINWRLEVVYPNHIIVRRNPTNIVFL